MLFWTSPEHGCVYSIDSEGTLYYSPQYQDGSVNLEDDQWCEVDFMSLMGEEQETQDEINEIQEKLIAASKAMGEYYQLA